MTYCSLRQTSIIYTHSDSNTNHPYFIKFCKHRNVDVARQFLTSGKSIAMFQMQKNKHRAYSFTNYLVCLSINENRCSVTMPFYKFYMFQYDWMVYYFHSESTKQQRYFFSFLIVYYMLVRCICVLVMSCHGRTKSTNPDWKYNVRKQCSKQIRMLISRCGIISA